MITRMPSPTQVPAWQRELAEAVTDIQELLALLELKPDQIGYRAAAAKPFTLRVPRGYVGRMRKADPDDPLLRQVLPAGAELIQIPGFNADPVGDLTAMPEPGVLHKYRGRALLVTTGACAIHCRYCFRRHFPYTEANPARGQWKGAIDYLASEATIHEVILSGGDPLTLSDRKLSQLAHQLGTLPHLRRLRVHTRLPVVLPSRVDGPLTDWLAQWPGQVVIVIHANHPRELDATVREALARLSRTGALLLNQTVLLRGVNDDPETLEALSEALLAAGALPYYLHLLDPVQGAGHFQVSATEATKIMGRLRGRLPGYLVPRLVREIPGAASKIPAEVAPQG